MGSNLILFLLMQFDLSFPEIPCSILSLDAIDISGEQHLDIVCAASINTLSLDPLFPYYLMILSHNLTSISPYT